MPSSQWIVIVLLSPWILCSIGTVLRENYFNRKLWFDDGNILHIPENDCWRAFQQHRNANRHFNWLTDEISSLNHQIAQVKEQLLFTDPRRERLVEFYPADSHLIDEVQPALNVTPHKNVSSPLSWKNQRNIYILNLLRQEPLFNGYTSELLERYQLLLSVTIECIAIVREKASKKQYLFVLSGNGQIDAFTMNRSQSLRETYWKMTESITTWNNAGRQLEYYRRFIQHNHSNEIVLTDQLSAMKNRPKLNDIHFFDMMGQVIRVKYRIDPTSLSCILEVFFGKIFTCDGRLIHPYELQLLSDVNNRFVFYAVMMDTPTEKQIYPLGLNNRIRNGDQIYFLYSNHPQFSSLVCKDCPRADQNYIFTSEQKTIEKAPERPMVEPAPILYADKRPAAVTSQNSIVYVLLVSILFYILYGIYLGRQRQSASTLAKKHAASSRRGR